VQAHRASGRWRTRAVSRRPSRRRASSSGGGGGTSGGGGASGGDAGGGGGASGGDAGGGGGGGGSSEDEAEEEMTEFNTQNEGDGAEAMRDIFENVHDEDYEAAAQFACEMAAPEPAAPAPMEE